MSLPGEGTGRLFQVHPQPVDLMQTRHWWVTAHAYDFVAFAKQTCGHCRSDQTGGPYNQNPHVYQPF